MKNNSVLVYGSVAYDSIETPFDKAEYILGGSASYAALAVAFFAPVNILTCVGSDFKDSDVKRLSSRGIGLEGMEVMKDKPTFFWKGKYYHNFNKRDTIEVRLDITENYEPKIPNSLKESAYVLLANTSPESQAKVLDAMSNPKFVVLDTMNLWINSALEDLKKLIKRVDLLILNDSEAQELTGENNTILCGDIILGMGAKCVIIKKGEHGSMLFHKDGFFTIPAYPVRKLLDPTGAGDSFAGALIGHIAKKDNFDFKTLKEAMLIATATASMTVESFSCYKLEEAGLEEIKKRENYIKEITTI